MNLADKIFNSIKAINSSAEFRIDDNNLDKITWLNGTTPISKSDIENKMQVIETEFANAETEKTNKKASGKQKLKDLGLDDDEIQALIGV